MSTVDRIVELIKELGITEKQFLDDLSLNRTLLSDWKSGKSKSFNKYLDSIADYFDVTTDYLLGKSNIRKPNVEVYDEHDHRVVLDDDALEMIDSLRSRPEMKMLFSVSKKATREDILQAVKIIEALKGDDE